MLFDEQYGFNSGTVGFTYIGNVIEMGGGVVSNTILKRRSKAVEIRLAY